MPMYNPPHPGESILVLCLEPFDLSVADGAVALEVDEIYLNDLCHGRESITADLAIRLEQVFGGTADSWMRLQASYDLEQIRAQSMPVLSAVNGDISMSEHPVEPPPETGAAAFAEASRRAEMLMPLSKRPPISSFRLWAWASEHISTTERDTAWATAAS